VSVASVPGGTRWTDVAVAGHTCAITSTGALWCWGANRSGQLGSGTASATPTTAPTAALGATWLRVAVTDYDYDIGLTCGIQTDHSLWCWGRDQPPTGTQHLVPTQIGSANTWASVAVGPASGAMTASAAICAVQINGTLWCWGQWLDGGKLNTSMIPVQVGRDADWSSVSIGGEICATRTGGTLWCWANQDWLGDGSPLVLDPQEVAVPATRPTQIGSDTDWRTVQTGGTSCATKTDGSLWCWGRGAAPIPQFVTTPTRVD
jgi:Regulator of Chromosome Condensation (RCC1) repeat protein